MTIDEFCCTIFNSCILLYINCKRDMKMNENLMNHYRTRLAENLPMLRTKLHMTQEDLAGVLDVSRHTIIGIEHKSRVMTWTTYLAIVYIMQQDKETDLLIKALQLAPQSLNELRSTNSEEEENEASENAETV